MRNIFHSNVHQLFLIGCLKSQNLENLQGTGISESKQNIKLNNLGNLFEVSSFHRSKENFAKTEITIWDINCILSFFVLILTKFCVITIYFDSTIPKGNSKFRLRPCKIYWNGLYNIVFFWNISSLLKYFRFFPKIPTKFDDIYAKRYEIFLILTFSARKITKHWWLIYN